MILGEAKSKTLWWTVVARLLQDVGLCSLTSLADGDLTLRSGGSTSEKAQKKVWFWRATTETEEHHGSGRLEVTEGDYCCVESVA